MDRTCLDQQSQRAQPIGECTLGQDGVQEVGVGRAVAGERRRGLIKRGIRGKEGRSAFSQRGHLRCSWKRQGLFWRCKRGGSSIPERVWREDKLAATLAVCGQCGDGSCRSLRFFLLDCDFQFGGVDQVGISHRESFSGKPITPPSLYLSAKSSPLQNSTSPVSATPSARTS